MQKETTTKASQNDTNDAVRCYKCRKLGHLITNYPLLKTKLYRFKSKKAMCTT